MPDTFAATPVFGAQPAPVEPTAKAAPVVEVKPQPAAPPKPAAKTDGAEAAKPEVEKPAEPSRKYKLKLDGAEEEVDEPELIRRAQKASAADRRFEEAAKARKEVATEKKWVQDFIGAAKEPAKLKQLLTDKRIGLDVKAVAREWLADSIKEQIAAEEEKNLSPEAKELRELKRKAAEEAAGAEKTKAEAAEKTHQETVEKHRDDFGQQIIGCMKAADFLPQDAVTAARISVELRKNVLEGRPFDVKDIVQRVDRAEGKLLAKRLEALGVDKVRSHLPKEWLAKFRDADVAEYKARGGKSEAKTSEKTAQLAPELRPPERGKGKSEAELRAELGKISWQSMISAQQARDAKSGQFKK